MIKLRKGNKMRNKSVIVSLPVILSVAGCTPQTNLPLIFGQTETVGITANAGTTQQSGELTFGYRDIDVAIVPTTITDKSGQVQQLKAEIMEQGPTGCTHDTDGLSVLGQFDVEVDKKADAAQKGDSATTAPTGTTPQVTLGKFFATGNAAKRLSDGFAHKLGDPAATTANTDAVNANTTALKSNTETITPKTSNSAKLASATASPGYASGCFKN